MYNLWRSKAKYQTANASFLRFSDGFWKLVLQNWWDYNYNLILKIDSKLYREQCLCEIFLAQLRSFKYIKHVVVILVLYLYMTVLFRFMSSCCCFDEPLFALNAFSKDRNTDKLIILTNCCYEGSFARVNCMRLLNFSLFRFLQLKAKGGFWFPDLGMPSRLTEPQEYYVLFKKVFSSWVRNDRSALRSPENANRKQDFFSQSHIYMSSAECCVLLMTGPEWAKSRSDFLSSVNHFN